MDTAQPHAFAAADSPPTIRLVDVELDEQPHGALESHEYVNCKLDRGRTSRSTVQNTVAILLEVNSIFATIERQQLRKMVKCDVCFSVFLQHHMSFCDELYFCVIFMIHERLVRLL